MKSLTERVMLASQDLDGLGHIQHLTREIEAMSAALEKRDRAWTVGELQRFRQLLDFTGGVIGRLSLTVRAQIEQIQGASINAS